MARVKFGSAGLEKSGNYDLPDGVYEVTKAAFCEHTWPVKEKSKRSGKTQIVFVLGLLSCETNKDMPERTLVVGDANAGIELVLPGEEVTNTDGTTTQLFGSIEGKAPAEYLDFGQFIKTLEEAGFNGDVLESDEVDGEGDPYYDYGKMVGTKLELGMNKTENKTDPTKPWSKLAVKALVEEEKPKVGAKKATPAAAKSAAVPAGKKAAKGPSLEDRTATYIVEALEKAQDCTLVRAKLAGRVAIVAKNDAEAADVIEKASDADFLEEYADGRWTVKGDKITAI